MLIFKVTTVSARYLSAARSAICCGKELARVRFSFSVVL